MGLAFVCSKAALKARRLDSTPVPPARIASSKAARANGSAPDAASAPNIVAEMTLPFALAIASMSKAMTRLAANSVASRHGGRIGDAVAGRLFLHHGQRPVGRGDQRRPVGRDEAAQHRTAGLHELGRHHHVEISRRRHEREHRLRAILRRRHLDVIDGCAGALRDARHGSRLRRPPLRFRKPDDPVGEHAAALSAHGENGERDALGRPSRCAGRDVAAHAASSTRRTRPRFRRASNQPITLARRAAMRRSQPVGLWRTSAR